MCAYSNMSLLLRNRPRLMRHDGGMDDRINLRSPLSRAYWCGNFSCCDSELMKAVRATHSTEVGTVGLYLATGRALETFEAPTGAETPAGAAATLKPLSGKVKPAT